MVEDQYYGKEQQGPAGDKDVRPSTHGKIITLTPYVSVLAYNGFGLP
jgi:hypothetical protein